MPKRRFHLLGYCPWPVMPGVAANPVTPLSRRSCAARHGMADAVGVVRGSPPQAQGLGGVPGAASRSGVFGVAGGPTFALAVQREFALLSADE